MNIRMFVSPFHLHRWRCVVMHWRIVVHVGIIFRIIEQWLKEMMTVVAKIDTDRVIEIGVSNELVNGMFGGSNFAIWGTNPFCCIMRIDGVGCNSCCGEKRMGITGVAVIQGPEGEEITKVMEVRNRLIGSMAVDHIVMVDTVHGEQNIRMSDCRWVSGTIAELVFKEEDFATCSAKQDMGIEGFTRRDKEGKSIVGGIFSVNMDNMVEKDGNIRGSKARLEMANRWKEAILTLAQTRKWEAWPGWVW